MNRKRTDSSKNQQNPLQGAGNPHSPAPSLYRPLPVYVICDVCGEAEEQSRVKGICCLCLAVVQEGSRKYEQQQRRFDWITAVVMAMVAAVIMWGWMR